MRRAGDGLTLRRMLQEFNGGVFSDDLPSGRAGATLSNHGGALQARTGDGATFTVAASDLRLELGGASGRMWLCRHQAGGVTLFSEAKGFTDLLKELGPAVRAQVDEQLTAGRRGARRGRWILLTVAALVGLLLWWTPAALRWGAGAAAAQLPTSVDAQLGQLGWSSISAQLVLLPESHPATTTMRTMIERLEKEQSQISDLDEWNYRVFVARDEQINAFALPGGWIVVMSGLIEAAETPDEVASVLAHEMGHVIHRHGLKRVAHSLGLIAALQLIIGDVGGLAATASQVLTMAAMNDYSRDAEREADQAGVQLMHLAGGDPYALATFFQRLEEKTGGQPDYLQWLSTHPSHQERIANVEALIADLPPREQIPWDTDWQTVRDSLADPGAPPTPEPELTPTTEEPTAP